jgi:hypothetical protein
MDAGSRSVRNLRHQLDRWDSVTLGDVAKVVMSLGDLQERINRDARPRTADDVSIAADGTRLDTKKKFLAHLERINQERASERINQERVVTVEL